MIAILIDFRTFDTLGEISVFAVAALSVLTLLGMWARTETRVQETEGRG